MRRLWAALVLTLVVAGLCLFHHYNLNRAYKETGRYVKRMVTQFEKGKYTEAAFTANELENNWKQNEESLERFISEEKLETVRMIVTELPQLAETENHEFHIHVKNLNAALQHILDKEKLCIN